MANTKMLAVRVPTDLVSALHAEADQRGCTVTAVVIERLSTPVAVGDGTGHALPTILQGGADLREWEMQPRNPLVGNGADGQASEAGADDAAMSEPEDCRHPVGRRVAGMCMECGAEV